MIISSANSSSSPRSGTVTLKQNESGKTVNITVKQEGKAEVKPVPAHIVLKTALGLHTGGIMFLIILVPVSVLPDSNGLVMKMEISEYILVILRWWMLIIVRYQELL